MLGMWVHRLRRDHKKATLPQWQVDLLDRLDFAWRVDVHSAKWHHNLHEARRYKVGCAESPKCATMIDLYIAAEGKKALKLPKKILICSTKAGTHGVDVQSARWHHNLHEACRCKVCCI